MLDIINLHAEVEGKKILQGLNLKINKGEIHSIMGPNGSGKSTLASILAGKEDYEVTDGDIIYNGESILELAPDERAQQGIFLAFQYPIEIPGVSNGYFLKEALNSINEARGKPVLKPVEFGKLIKEKIKKLKMDDSFLKRSLNEGFSGGEKKRNEILQMAILDPIFSVLDETDSGLDIDALQIVADGVNSLRSPEKAFLVITHYQRLLDYIVPDFVHVLVNGKIVKSGDKGLALELESKGYSWLEG
tara:strand:- start:1685 stop:2425 length:741 start_codon:yes stop_codon:yes gene_type:complete